MTHDYYIRNRKKETQDTLIKLEMILKSINNLNDESINLKDTVIKKLPEDNGRLHRKCNQKNTVK